VTDGTVKARRDEQCSKVWEAPCSNLLFDTLQAMFDCAVGKTYYRGDFFRRHALNQRHQYLLIRPVYLKIIHGRTGHESSVCADEQPTGGGLASLRKNDSIIDHSDTKKLGFNRVYHRLRYSNGLGIRWQD